MTELEKGFALAIERVKEERARRRYAEKIARLQQQISQLRSSGKEPLESLKSSAFLSETSEVRQREEEEEELVQ